MGCTAQSRCQHDICLPYVTGDLVWLPAAPSPLQSGILLALRTHRSGLNQRPSYAATAISTANLHLTQPSKNRAAAMKTTLHGWRCNGDDAGVSGGVSHHGDGGTPSAATSRRMWVQPSGAGQGSPPAAPGMPVPLTSPNSPFEPSSRIGCWAQQGRFHVNGCFSLLPW